MSDVHIPTIPPEKSDPRSWDTFWIGAVGIILTVVVVVLLQVLYFRTVQNEHERKVLAAEPLELLETLEQQRATLDSYGWVDQEQGIAAIPIEEAMKKIVAENGGDGK